VQPQVSGQQPCQGCDDGTVGPVQFRAGNLAAQDGYLVPQDQDLRVLGGMAPCEQRQPAEQPDHEQVDETDEPERRA